jgi:hypothetical protein
MRRILELQPSAPAELTGGTGQSPGAELQSISGVAAMSPPVVKIRSSETENSPVITLQSGFRETRRRPEFGEAERAAP